MTNLNGTFSSVLQASFRIVCPCRSWCNQPDTNTCKPISRFQALRGVPSKASITIGGLGLTSLADVPPIDLFICRSIPSDDILAIQWKATAFAPHPNSSFFDLTPPSPLPRQYTRLPPGEARALLQSCVNVALGFVTSDASPLFVFVLTFLANISCFAGWTRGIFFECQGHLRSRVELASKGGGFREARSYRSYPIAVDEGKPVSRTCAGQVEGVMANVLPSKFSVITPPYAQQQIHHLRDVQEDGGIDDPQIYPLSGQTLSGIRS